MTFENGVPEGWIDGNLYNVNRNKFPLEELQKHAGEWVAFWKDGTRIVASSKDLVALAKTLDERGIASTDVVLSEIHPDEVGLE